MVKEFGNKLIVKKERGVNLKSAIVTGANGFVGTWLVHELVANDIFVYAIIKDETENIDNIANLKNLEVIYCDLNEISLLFNKLCGKSIDLFYHLAWVGSAGLLRAAYEIQLNNVKYSCDAAKVAHKLNCKRFLAAGTITERIVESVLDKKAVSQNMIYGICKKNASLILKVLCETLNMEFVWMQFSNIYGPLNKSGNLISYTLEELINGKIPTFSKGEQPYDFIYIKDIIYAMYLLGIKDLNHNFYFLGSGNCKKLKEYLLQIPQIMGEKYRIGLGKRPEDGVEYKKEWFDISKLVEDTGYISKYSFERGICETLEWICCKDDRYPWQE